MKNKLSGFTKAVASIGAVLFNTALITAGCDGAKDDMVFHGQTSNIVLSPTTGNIETFIDSSAAPVYVQIRKCTTESPANSHSEVGCQVDPEYALVGGGARTVTYQPASHQAYQRSDFITESRPLDGRTWQASSTDHLIDSQHDLEVYAIGLRLEGAHTQRLRDAISWKKIELDGDSAAVQISQGAKFIGGGAKTTPGPGIDRNRFLTATYFTGDHWQGTSTEHMLPANGKTSVWLLEIEDKVIEGFGALAIEQLEAEAVHTSNGFGTSTVQVEQGWALIGMGASVVSDSDSISAARMLTEIAPGADNRSVSVTSRNYINMGAGTTRAYAIQAQKIPGTHGLCNAGTKMPPDADSCVTAICGERSECCNNAWDDVCVGMVESVPECKRSCAAYTCERTVFEPERWNYNHGTTEDPVYKSGGWNVPSNCTNYALNKYPDEYGMEPGDSLNLLHPEINYGDGILNRRVEMIKGEGLIPSTYAAECPENRTKVFFQNAGTGNYHWFRQDASGEWSDKMATAGEARLSTEAWFDHESIPPFVDVPIYPYQRYFCACNQPLPDIDPPFGGLAY